MDVELKIPKHIAFIMDGNGRWAEKRKKARAFGHIAGYEAMDKLITIAFNKGIETLSFYAFSTENWSRPKEEVDKLLSLMKKAIKISAPKLIKNNVKLIVSGDLSVLETKTKKLLSKLISDTSEFKNKTLNICFNYGSRLELCNAFNNMIKDGVTTATEEIVNKYLWTNEISDPDMVIRTSGEMRLSNFLLWQSAYAELYFTQTLWPDFDEKALDEAILWYSKRNRKFGKI